MIAMTKRQSEQSQEDTHKKAQAATDDRRCTTTFLARLPRSIWREEKIVNRNRLLDLAGSSSIRHPVLAGRRMACIINVANSGWSHSFYSTVLFIACIHYPSYFDGIDELLHLSLAACFRRERQGLVVADWQEH